jgi:hypothetical protein
MATKSWSFGDRVVHVSRPEWGAGVVTGTSTGEQNGVPCQMVTIRFERAGVKTLSTAFATLREATAHDANLGANGTTPDHSDAHDPFMAKMRQAAAGGDPKVSMLKISDDAVDPFATPLQRFNATLSLFRYTPTGRSLLDWAAVQSGLVDPLSRYNRHELEKFFEQWVIGRDNHLKKVAQELKRADPAALHKAIGQAPPGVQQTLRRLDALR